MATNERCQSKGVIGVKVARLSPIMTTNVDCQRGVVDISSTSNKAGDSDSEDLPQ